MRPVFTPEESAALDRAAQGRGIAAASLMERAGEAVARAAVDLAGGVYGRRAVVVCGKGNNGGDGLVAARRLARWGIRVRVLLLDEPGAFHEPAGENLRRLREAGVRARPFGADLVEKELARADVAVDAIFGTGFRGVPEGVAADAIRALNGSDPPIVAADIPSGVDGRTGAVEGEAVVADATVAFGAEKPGTVLFPGAAHAGFVDVADIGFPPDLVTSRLGVCEASDVAAVLPARGEEAHKRSTGVVLVIAGSREMTGAPRLVAGGALRIGAGLVTVAAPVSALPAVQAGLVEATFLTLPETDAGTIAPGALDRLKERLHAVDAVAIGPGLGRDADTAAFARELVRSCPAPLVVDADALNAFEGRAAQLAERSSDAVLTPHLGEAARLTGRTSQELAADRIGSARSLAADAGAIALLKGSRTVVAAPSGEARINETGGPRLATGGTGDVLTGVVAGLLARGLAPIEAASAGAFIHGVAGRLAGREAGEGTTAGDVLAAVAAGREEVLSSGGAPG